MMTLEPILSGLFPHLKMFALFSNAGPHFGPISSPQGNHEVFMMSTLPACLILYVPIIVLLALEGAGTELYTI